jgi:hypothetical protein
LATWIFQMAEAAGMSQARQERLAIMSSDEAFARFGVRAVW